MHKETTEYLWRCLNTTNQWLQMSCFVVIVAADECRWRQGGEWTATLLALKAVAHSTRAHLSYSEPYCYCSHVHTVKCGLHVSEEALYNKRKLKKMQIYVHIKIKSTNLILHSIKMQYSSKQCTKNVIKFSCSTLPAQGSCCSSPFCSTLYTFFSKLLQAATVLPQTPNSMTYFSTVSMPSDTHNSVGDVHF